jgi:hypothetical protein
MTQQFASQAREYGFGPALCSLPAMMQCISLDSNVDSHSTTQASAPASVCTHMIRQSNLILTKGNSQVMCRDATICSGHNVNFISQDATIYSGHNITLLVKIRHLVLGIM